MPSRSIVLLTGASKGIRAATASRRQCRLIRHDTNQSWSTGSPDFDTTVDPYGSRDEIINASF